MRDQIEHTHYTGFFAHKLLVGFEVTGRVSDFSDRDYTNSPHIDFSISLLETTFDHDDGEITKRFGDNGKPVKKYSPELAYDVEQVVINQALNSYL